MFPILSSISLWFSNKYNFLRFLFKIFRNGSNLWNAVKAFPTSLVPDDIRTWTLQWVLPSVNQWCEFAKTTANTWDDYLSEAIRRLLVEGVLWDEVTTPAIREREILPTRGALQRLRARIREARGRCAETPVGNVSDDVPDEKEAGSLAMAAVILSIIVNGAAGAKIISAWLGWKTEAELIDNSE